MRILKRLLYGFLAFTAAVVALAIFLNSPAPTQNDEYERRVAAARELGEQNAAEFRQLREQVMSDASMLVDAEAWQELLNRFGKYRVADDSEFNAMLDRASRAIAERKNRARESQLLAELRDIPASSFEANQVRYLELAKMFPEEERYAEKLAHYTARIRERDEQRAREKRRQEQISSHFSPWDGSHRALVRFVKERLRDPDSFDHVETRYYVKDDMLNVYMKYRARNGFGGMSFGEVTAETDLDGKQLRITSSSDS